MIVTAYDDSGEDNGYNVGSWYFLYLDRWNKRYNYGPLKGKRYTGKTAGGHDLKSYHPGLVSWDSLARPWRIPIRILLPWLWLYREGTIAADTDYYPLGARMHVPGWGWGMVDDRGGAIKGPNRIDVFIPSKGEMLRWGRQELAVKVYRKHGK